MLLKKFYVTSDDTKKGSFIKGPRGSFIRGPKGPFIKGLKTS